MCDTTTSTTLIQSQFSIRATSNGKRSNCQQFKIRDIVICWLQASTPPQILAITSSSQHTDRKKKILNDFLFLNQKHSIQSQNQLQRFIFSLAHQVLTWRSWNPKLKWKKNVGIYVSLSQHFFLCPISCKVQREQKIWKNERKQPFFCIFCNQLIALQLFQIENMAERKPWSQREDQILKDLRQVRLIAKWSQIAQIMKSQFQIFGRNGKQCRERYHNHLDSRICKQKWGAQEENKLLALHHQLGNRWAAISRELPGRTDNCVKNHFYSFLCKCIKNVNYSLNVLSERKIRPLKLSIMNKIVSIIEAHHKDPHNFDMTVYKDARDLKEKIFNFGEILTVTQENCREKLFQLSKKLADLNKTSRKNYARKRKAKIVYDESEQLHLKSKDQQFDQQEPPLDLGKITNEVKCEPEPIGPYKLCFPAWSTPSKRGETKKEEKSRNSAVKKEERMSENKNINSNLMVKAENITPEKQGREEKQKSSSYCKLYSVDYLDGNYPVPDVRDFIFIDDEKEWRFQLD